jgi:hypothetical protein
MATSNGCLNTIIAVVVALGTFGVTASVTNDLADAIHRRGNTPAAILVGASPFLAAFLALLLTGYLIRKTAEGAEKAGRVREERAAARAREAAMCDFALMDDAFERAHKSAERVEESFLHSTIIRVLNGEVLGRDEFERREFAQNKERKIKEFDNRLFMCRARGNYGFGEFDFEKNRFPVWVSFYDLKLFNAFNKTTGERVNSIDGFLRMDYEKAKSFRQSKLSIKDVNVVVRTSRMNPGVRIELVGLRLTVAPAA